MPRVFHFLKAAAPSLPIGRGGDAPGGVADRGAGEEGAEAYCYSDSRTPTADHSRYETFRSRAADTMIFTASTTLAAAATM